MKKIVFAGLLLFIVVHVPWRLATLVLESWILRPGLVRTSTQHDQYWRARDLEARARFLGYEVRYVPDLTYYGQPAYGIRDDRQHIIFVLETLSWNDRRHTLLHELGHVLQPGWFSPDEAEAFAEAVAAVNSGDIRESARYLTRYRGSLLQIAFSYSGAIYRAAGLLEDR